MASEEQDEEELPKLSHFEKAKILEYEMAKNPKSKSKLTKEFKIEKLKSAYGNIDRYLKVGGGGGGERKQQQT